MQVGGVPVLDLTEHEELCIDSSLQVSVNSRGAVCGISQQGSAGISPATLQVREQDSTEKGRPALFTKLFCHYGP